MDEVHSAVPRVSANCSDGANLSSGEICNIFLHVGGEVSEYGSSGSVLSYFKKTAA